MKIMAILDRLSPQVNISKVVLKYIIKKQNKEQILRKHTAKKPDILYVAAIATLTYKSISFFLTLKEMTKL